MMCPLPSWRSASLALTARRGVKASLAAGARIRNGAETTTAGLDRHWRASTTLRGLSRRTITASDGPQRCAPFAVTPSGLPFGGAPLRLCLNLGVGWRAAGFAGVLDNQATELRVSVAALANQKPYQCPHAFHIRAVDDGSSLAAAAQKACPHQNGQMGGKCVVRRANGIGDYAGGDTNRLVLNEQPEDRQARGLSKCSKSRNRMGFGQLSSVRPGAGVAGNGQHRFPHSVVSARVV